MKAVLFRSLLFCLLSYFIDAALPDKPMSRGINRKAPNDEEYSIHSFFDKQDQKIPTSSSLKEKELLYGAYNALHTLAQDFHKPFDAPAVIVVGHQTSGKSALIEALMGFQFNQVGGGTKTRRPIALRMQYNPNCATPVCFLTQDNGKEEQRSLEDIQAYIESENKRLERDATRSFDPREINIRMEYRYCPNMIVIDTPGLIQSPKGRQMTVQNRAIAQASREAEALVLDKIKCEDYIILCVEDCSDWKHSTTRNVVMQADPQLTRTVLVNPKLDTKLVQFSAGDDLEDFLHAPLVHQLSSQLMGGPFFTSVPSGRVGTAKEYENNDAFVQGLRQVERSDRALAVSKMGAVKARSALQNVGVSRLRTFLESRVEDSYRRNVAKIVPLLQSELRSAEARLAEIDAELKSLSVDHLRQMANEYRERFAKELSNAIQGSVKASPMEWGETLEVEAARSASFLQQNEVNSETWQGIVDNEIGNNNHKLYGGAQYHRAMKEFNVAVRHMASQVVTEDEIANAAGMGERSNSVNFMRAACVIAMDKAGLSFFPMLDTLQARTSHVMKRMFPIVEEMVRKSAVNGGGASLGLGAHSAAFQHMMRTAFERFVDQRIELSVQRCREDLEAMLRYVTFDMEDKGGASNFYPMLPTPKRMAEIYNIAVENEKKHHEEDADREEDAAFEEEEQQQQQSSRRRTSPAMGWRMSMGRTAKKMLPAAERIVADWKQANSNRARKSIAAAAASSSKGRRSGQGAGWKQGDDYAVTPASPFQDADELKDHYRIMQLTEEMVSGTSASRTSALVTALVQFITSSWRNHFAKATTMKLNTLFLLPFMDDFPAFLRNEVDNMYSAGMGELFDIGETRRALQARRAELLAECTANSKLQARFDQIAAKLHPAASTSSTSPASASVKSAAVSGYASQVREGAYPGLGGAGLRSRGESAARESYSSNESSGNTGGVESGAGLESQDNGDDIINDL